MFEKPIHLHERSDHRNRVPQDVQQCPPPQIAPGFLVQWGTVGIVTLCPSDVRESLLASDAHLLSTYSQTEYHRHCWVCPVHGRRVEVLHQPESDLYDCYDRHILPIDSVANELLLMFGNLGVLCGRLISRVPVIGGKGERRDIREED